jgi:hypothetical protein
MPRGPIVAREAQNVVYFAWFFDKKRSLICEKHIIFGPRSCNKIYFGGPY